MLILSLFIILNLLPHIFATFASENVLLNWYLTDDAFYYFKTAQNIGEGVGITFDGLVPTNGFHPLWMGICIPIFLLARFDLYIPLRVLIIVQALLNAASGYFIFRLFADEGKKLPAWLVSFFWMFFLSVHGITTKLGLESGVNAFSIIFLVYSISLFSRSYEDTPQETRGLIGVAAASIFALLARLDNIFIVMMVGVWLVFRKSKMRWMSQIDFSLIFITVFLSYFLRIQSTDNILNFLPFAYLMTGFSLVVKPILFYFFELYEIDIEKKARDQVIRIVLAVSVSGVLMAGFFYIIHDVLHLFRGYSRSVIILDFAISLIWVTVSRLIYWKQSHRGDFENVDVSLKTNFSFWLKRLAAYFVPLIFALSGYMLLNNSYAGLPMPVSGQIKRWWGKMPNSVYGQPNKTLGQVVNALGSADAENGPFWLITRPVKWVTEQLMGFMQIEYQVNDASFKSIQGLIWVVIVSLIATTILQNKDQFQKITKKIGILPLLTGVIFHAISFQATGYLHTRYWYWIEEMVLITIFGGVLLTEPLEFDTRHKIANLGKKLIVVGSCVGLYFSLSLSIIKEFHRDENRQGLYTVDADTEFILSNTKEENIIGMTGGGLSGYFIPDRTFVNLDGLISGAEYFSMMKDGRANEYLEKIHLEYVYGDEQVLLDSDPYRWIFTDRLEFISQGPYFSLYRFCPQGCDQSN